MGVFGHANAREINEGGDVLARTVVLIGAGNKPFQGFLLLYPGIRKSRISRYQNRRVLPARLFWATQVNSFFIGSCCQE
jgi:hypothetical protein